MRATTASFSNEICGLWSTFMACPSTASQRSLTWCSCSISAKASLRTAAGMGTSEPQLRLTVAMGRVGRGELARLCASPCAERRDCEPFTPKALGGTCRVHGYWRVHGRKWRELAHKTPECPDTQHSRRPMPTVCIGRHTNQPLEPVACISKRSSKNRSQSIGHRRLVGVVVW